MGQQGEGSTETTSRQGNKCFLSPPQKKKKAEGIYLTRWKEGKEQGARLGGVGPHPEQCMSPEPFWQAGNYY